MRNPVFLAPLALIACASVDRDGVAQLRTFSPLTADPAGLAARVDLPDGLAIPADGATLVLAARRSDTGASRSGTFALARAATVDGGSVYVVPPAEIERFRSLQDEIGAWEAADPEATEGTFSVAVTACVVGAGPAPDATVSVDIRTDPDGAFVPLVRRAPLEQVVRLATGGQDGCLRPPSAPASR
jgi:hypothetical protein